jgi:hypothetical protein
MFRVQFYVEGKGYLNLEGQNKKELINKLQNNFKLDTGKEYSCEIIKSTYKKGIAKYGSMLGGLDAMGRGTTAETTETIKFIIELNQDTNWERKLRIIK